MRSHVHRLRFESLETRTLLSTSHSAVAHSDPARAAGPVLLDGTLTVNNSTPTTTENPDGSTTTSVPIKGEIGSLGEVHGFWNETEDEYGDYVPPDTLRLHNSDGTVIVAFNNGNPGPAQKNGHGTYYYQDGQVIYTATGAYTGAQEAGTIDLVTNHARTEVTSLRLQTQRT